MERENDGQLPFLDTLVIRSNDQTIKTRWYAKPISSGRLLNYHSFHPTSMKINVASNFIQRVIQLTTDGSAQQQKQKIFQYLRQNNYPSSLINRMLNRINENPAHQWIQPTSSIVNIQHNLSQSSPSNIQSTSLSPLPTTSSPPSPPFLIIPTHTPSIDPCDVNTSQTPRSQPSSPPNEANPNSQETAYRSMLNIPFLTTTISNILKKDFKNIKIARRNFKTTKSLLKPVKDPVLPYDQHNVIYNIPCNDCDQVYIGMTTNNLKKRISGHRSDINKISKSPENNIHAKTALIQHMINNQHTFDLDNTQIIDRTFRQTALPILEMCHIQNTPNTVNYRTDVEGLNITYAGILHTVKANSSRRGFAHHHTRSESVNESEQMRIL
ncbi:uncharacterized protein LOC134215193 [Armigeres subalbatus]|uniref:uncharacterized protein LOC134215193 n=1 Tax=Armigeres subalbatus TaxID=124917 RepID=UPI002ED41162